MLKNKGASSNVTNCVTAIENTGLKRSFSRCKSYISNALQFCKSPTSNHVKVCKAMLTSISLATSECDLEAQQGNPASEYCKTISQPKRSKGSCKPGQFSGQIPGSSSIPACVLCCPSEYTIKDTSIAFLPIHQTKSELS